MALDAADEFMGVEVAEPASESLVLLGRDVLVAEEDHQMVQESLPNFRDRIVVERLRQIDSANLRAERAGDRMHLDPVERIGDSVRRSEEHTSELQSLMRISYAVFCLKKKKK